MQTITPIIWLMAGIGFTLYGGMCVGIVIDLIRFRKGEKTISEILLDIGEQWPIVPYFIAMFAGMPTGGLMAHLWYPKADGTPLWMVIGGYVLMIITTIPVWCYDHYMRKRNEAHQQQAPEFQPPGMFWNAFCGFAIGNMVGMILGHYVFGQ